MNAPSAPCIVVAGMGRCGTSLTMQMLDAAGVPCIGDWPAYETDASSIGGFNAARFASLSGCAVKLIDPANLPVADMPNHIVIWLDRDPRQQARSQAKLIRACGLDVGRAGTRAIESDLRKSRTRHQSRVGVPGGCPCLIMHFERLLTGRAEIERLSAFLGAHGWPAPVDVMLAQVERRPADCLPGFLEVQLLDRGRTHHAI